jgi:RNA polymerase sigma-70 factor (ECF subfamily)
MNTNGSQQVGLSEPAPARDDGSASLVQPEFWVEKYADVLFGFAANRVRDPAIAQDLVQETFLAAMKARQSFRGRSTERAWLFGILRHKLVDFYRQQGRELQFADLESLPEEQGAFCATGMRKDGWLKGLAPKAWETPEEALVSKEFQEVLKGCLSKLPERLAQVFMLRELDGADPEEICMDLDVSPNNLWVMLHRARMGLRRCLELHWFATKQRDEMKGTAGKRPAGDLNDKVAEL